MDQDFNGIELIAHPLVPEGLAWRVDRSVFSFEAPGVRGYYVFLHPLTLQRLKTRLWAKHRTIASITFAQLMIELGAMRDEAP